ncbi:MAG: DUF1572 family protein [Rhodothermales bacterium]|nr:DUF1572 family protein [Rhodothermales bacterium]MBO6778592.1 DUF1572 family protein [Rhodothermales bacterium]
MSVFPEVSAHPAAAFLQQSRAQLRDEYVPKILACLDRLQDKDVWWRPNPASNSIGNLVLHLCGNARQWIIASIAGEHDIRVRSAEFSADGEFDAATLARLLETTMKDIDAALANLEESRLSETRTVQGFSMTVLQAVYHVVEHFSGHTGQITYITKLRIEEDLGFYEAAADGSVTTRW